MKKQPVNSGAIRAIGYDPEREELEVEFRSGSTYTYPGVSAEEHEHLVNADSIGAHFQKHIRPKGGTR